MTVPISPASGPALTATEIYEKNVDSIVSIEGEGEDSYGSGTGVIMTQDGYILTNAHVVADMRRVRVIFSDNSILPARLVGADAEEDIAVLKVEAEELKPAEFGALTSCAAAIWWSPSEIPWDTGPPLRRESYRP